MRSMAASLPAKVLLRILSTVLIAAVVSACGDGGPGTPGPASAKVQIAQAPDPTLPPAMRSAPLDDAIAISRIAFGSCFMPDTDDSVFDRIAEQAPQAFLFVGDNAYAKRESAAGDLAAQTVAYARLAASDAFARLRSVTPVLATWDDHDYGLDDAGGDFPGKYASEALFEHAWALPDDDERRGRDGVYFSRTIGPSGRRVQFVVLDTRFFRSRLRPTDAPGTPGRERYVPDPDPSKTLLGEAQWAWLEQVLSEPADLRFVVSSVQVLGDGHGWEGWHQLPEERRRLFSLIGRTRASGVVLLSGDRHMAGFYSSSAMAPYPIADFTSSSLNLPLRDPALRAARLAEAGQNRIGPLYADANFGLVEIDWEARTVTLSIRDAGGRPVRTRELRIDDLRAR